MSTHPKARIRSLETCSLTGEINVVDVKKSYGHRDVLAGITLNVPAGQSLAIMGVSGSGKSTLLHLLSGIDVPDSGRVLYGTNDGELDISSISEHERTEIRLHHLGFVFQRGLLLPELTAQENVALPCLLAGRTKEESLATAMEKLAGVGMANYGARRPGQLSGGESQRVAIARAIVTQPEIVFADEPTAALDSETGGGVMEELLSATIRQSRTLIVVTHDRAVAKRCERIVEIRDGTVIESAESL